jgi:hypothetical protein
MIYSVDQYNIFRLHNDDMSVVKVIPEVESNTDYQAMQIWRQLNDLVQITGMPKPVDVPRAVTPRQIRIALTHVGLRDTVESFVAQASRDVQDVWEFSVEVQRQNPILLQMMPLLGLSSQQIDDLFILASTL